MEEDKLKEQEAKMDNKTFTTKVNKMFFAYLGMNRLYLLVNFLMKPFSKRKGHFEKKKWYTHW